MITRRRREDGNAAVEMILVVPVLLIFLVGIRHGSAMFLHDIHASTAVRNAAWRASLHSHARALSFIPAARQLCRDTELEQGFGGRYRVLCRDDAGFPGLGRAHRTSFVRGLRNAGRQEWNRASRLTQEIDRPRQRPQFREARIDSSYRSLDFDWATARWDNTHVVDANRVWQRRDMRRGYHRELQRQGSRNLFRRAFPNPS